MITERQEKILQCLVESYIAFAEPISSNLLKESRFFDISPATIRNDLQELTGKGYINQPHTSSGRVPTQKAYKYYVNILFSQDNAEFPEFLLKEIEAARQKIEKEMELARGLMKSLEEIHISFYSDHLEEKNMLDMLAIIGPSKTACQKHSELMRQLIKELETF